MAQSLPGSFKRIHQQWGLPVCSCALVLCRQQVEPVGRHTGIRSAVHREGVVGIVFAEVRAKQTHKGGIQAVHPHYGSVA